MPWHVDRKLASNANGTRRLSCHFNYFVNYLEELWPSAFFKPSQKIHLFWLWDTSFQFFNLKAWWQWLLQFFSLFLIFDDEGVKKSWASNLEFGTIRILLYLNALGILSPGFKKEIFDLFNFSWHFDDFFFKDVSPEINVYKIRISVNQKQ